MTCRENLGEPVLLELSIDLPENFNASPKAKNRIKRYYDEAGRRLKAYASALPLKRAARAYDEAMPGMFIPSKFTVSFSEEYSPEGILCFSWEVTETSEDGAKIRYVDNWCAETGYPLMQKFNKKRKKAVIKDIERQIKEGFGFYKNAEGLAKKYFDIYNISPSENGLKIFYPQNTLSPDFSFFQVSEQWVKG